MQRQVCFLCLGWLLCVLVGVAHSAELDWSTYERVLQRHVSQGEIHGVALSVVDYAKLKDDADFAAVVSQLATFDTSGLHNPAEKLSFYINVYNILAMKMITDHWPVQSIRDIGTWYAPVWKKEAGLVGGKVVSLHEVEHEVLRKLDEPRIHFAIVCASVSCPDLLNEPYRAKSLDAQLDRQVRSFLNNAEKGVAIVQDKISVSKILDWFAEDFSKAGGVESFVKRYRPDLPAFRFETDIDYDWVLNGR